MALGKNGRSQLAMKVANETLWDNIPVGEGESSEGARY